MYLSVLIACQSLRITSLRRLRTSPIWFTCSLAAAFKVHFVFSQNIFHDLWPLNCPCFLVSAHLPSLPPFSNHTHSLWLLNVGRRSVDSVWRNGSWRRTPLIFHSALKSAACRSRRSFIRGLRSFFNKFNVAVFCSLNTIILPRKSVNRTLWFHVFFASALKVVTMPPGGSTAAFLVSYLVSYR